MSGLTVGGRVENGTHHVPPDREEIEERTGCGFVSETLIDTGLRSADRYEMWIDSADPDRLWLIRNEEHQVWQRDTGFTFGCM